MTFPPAPLPARRRRDLLIVAAVPLLLLLPFVAKPLHVDDPMYVWAARQIAAHPLDPYGFATNWGGHRLPMVQVMQNPPLVPYYMAAAATVTGWGEIGLHAAFLPVAVAAAIGTYLLAGEFCRRPLAAAMLLIASPAFLVSCTTLMCEGPLLCLWVWAVYLWVRGSAAATAGHRWGLLMAAGLAVAAATLAKYPGVNLVPLLAAHAVLCPARRARAAQSVALLVPVALLVAYDRVTAARYGYGLMADAFGYAHAATVHTAVPAAGRALDALCFVGGGGLTVAAVGAVALVGAGPWWRPAAVAVAVPVLGIAASHWFWTPPVWADPAGPPAWAFFAQCGLLAVAGAVVVGACVAGVRWAGPADERRQGLFLLLWAGGVFTFAAFLNWAVNTRSILPLLPAACILAVRATDDGRRRWPTASRVAVVAAGGMAMLVAVADRRFAVDDRDAAVRLSRQLVATGVPGGPRPPRVWFGGHWGFQFYMQAGGAEPVDDDGHGYAVGDWVVLPLDNYGTRPLTVPLDIQSRVNVGGPSWLTTMNRDVGAGFHFSPGTRLPFVVGPVPPEAFLVARVRR